MRVFFIGRRFLPWVVGGMTVSLLWLGFWQGRILYRLTLAQPTTVRIALVIDDFGGYAAGVQAMMDLPFPLTFAVMPFEEFAGKQAEQAIAKGHEVLVHLPFEAYSADPSWYGKYYITTSTPGPEISRLIQEAFRILPMATGMNNHMGSLATGDSRVMGQVLTELSKLNRFYLDSCTAKNSPVPQLVSRQNLPLIQRDIFLDEQAGENWIRSRLRDLVERARSRGQAVGIGHVGPGGPLLARILREEIPVYQKQGCQFVHLSELVHAKLIKPSSSIEEWIVGIDPGHGGIDPGTHERDLLEKDINLLFSKTLADKLNRIGIQTVLTRNGDYLLSPYCSFKYPNHPFKRDDLTRRLVKLERERATVILSIHANWSREGFRRGPLVFYAPGFAESQRLAERVQKQLNAVQPYRKIAKPGEFYLLESAKVPTVLIELGYLSNREDLCLIMDPNYRALLIGAIERGLAEYYQLGRKQQESIRVLRRPSSPGLDRKPAESFDPEEPGETPGTPMRLSANP